MIEPKTYRKKPVHVKAIEFNGNNSKQVEKFVYGESHEKYFASSPHMTIQTLEGDMKVSKGDYIIRGVAGEFYPCKPDIFKATYEEVDQDGNRVNSTQYPSSFWEVMSDYFQECQELRQSDFTVRSPDPVPASDHASSW